MKYKIKVNNILVKEIEGNKIFFCGTVGEDNDSAKFADEEEEFRFTKDEAKAVIAKFFPDKSFREMAIPATGYICYMWGDDRYALKSRKYETLKEFKNRLVSCGFGKRYHLEFSEWEEL